MDVLYRKYRPQKLSEVVGQPQVTETLVKQLESGKIHHAYLFSGPKGTGKTSTARILAKALNCKGLGGRGKGEEKFGEPCGKCENCEAIAAGRFLDLIEIDAASNRGIDDVRELREKIKLSPSSGRYKVYIIDEAHMLTAEAFNALLKTLEEPPAHAVFILATTEPHKLPGTIISRSQRFNFVRPKAASIQEKLEKEVKAEGWKIGAEALTEIAKAGDGAFRDAEVLLEKVAGVNPLATKEEVLELLGKKDISQVLELLEATEGRKIKEALLWLDDFINGGGNVRVLNEAIIEILRKILLIKNGLGEELVKDVNPEVYSNIILLSNQINSGRLNKLIGLFTKAIEELAMATIPQLPLELALVEACDFQVESDRAIEPSGEQFGKETPLRQGSAGQAKGTEEKEEPAIKLLRNRAKEEQKKIKSSGSRKSEKQILNKQSLRPSDYKVQDDSFNGKKTEVSEEKILKKVKDAWPAILKESRSQNKSLEIFLRAAIPDRVEEDTLFLKFSYRFHKDMVEEPKYRSILEAILEKQLQTSVKIKSVLVERPKKVEQEPKLETRDEVDPAGIFGKLD